jgi:hypothetical protein
MIPSEDIFEEEFLQKVSQMTPEDAMNTLKQGVVENWWRRRILGEKYDTGTSGNYDAPWTEAYKAIELLEQNPGPEALAELGADFSEGFTRKVIARLWDKLDVNQQKRVLRSIKRGIALHGLEEFFDALLTTLHGKVPLKDEGGDVLAMQILNKAYEFIDGKISFNELMDSIAELLASYLHTDASKLSELFREVKTLGSYVSSSDLKKFVSRLFSLVSSLVSFL